MASRFGIVDIPALTKLTWELYNQCQPAARDAPDSFRNLVTELGSFQGTLRGLGDDVSSNTSFFDKMDDDRQRTLDRCLDSCSNTLQRLKELVAQYREFGIGEGKHFWQRTKAQIEDIRSRIMVHTCNLNLCMSSIGNADLARLEQSMLQAMEEDEHILLNADMSGPDEDVISPLSLRGGMSFGDFDQRNETDINRPLRTRMPDQRSPNRFTNRTRHVSTSSESNFSGSDGSLWGGTAPMSPQSLNTSRHVAQSMMGRISHAQTRSDQLLEGMDGRTLGKGIGENNSDFQEKQSMDKSSDSISTEFGHSNVMEAVTSAMHQLRQIRLQEQLSRPIRYEPQDQLHIPSPEIMKKFESSVNDELRIRRLITRDWLRVATWWLLKARTTLANCNRHNFVSARGSMSPSIDSRSTSHQAYSDLLKASYILYDIVLKDESSPALLTDENRKSIADLSEGINEELSQYTSVDIPEPFNLLSHNLDIWEPLQPEEASDNRVDFSFGLENTRWIVVDQDDAGDEEERVLYRTFVNAGIGGKKFRMRTKGAPYMLLLATREGESEPKIILCNQSGSLCLERDFVPDDLPPLIRLSNASLTGFPGTRISEPLPFKFDNVSVSISFQFEADLGYFINIPKAYFDAVWQREPVDSNEFTESVIFKSSVEMFEQLKTPNMKSMNPPVILKSCEVRILERSFGEAWRSTRRMVISSSAADKTPGVMDFFMPLSRVQLSREDVSRQVLLKWSDPCQERADKTDGNYNLLHSYVYDSNAPNIGVGLHFQTQQGAEDFEKAVLEMNLRPNFAWSQPSSSGCVYDVVDTGTEHKQYKAVVLFQNRLSWRYSDLYYLYRDTDYAYSHYSLSIRFPHVYYTDYISTHVDQLYRADSPVRFSHCEKKVGHIAIEFSNEPVSRSLLSALSPLHNLVFSRRVHSLSTKKGNSLFGSKKSGKGGTELQLWRRGTSFQLASRWDDSVSDKWLTMSLPAHFVDCSKENTRVSFPRLPYTRGSTIDMMNLVARNPETSNMGQKEGAISIIFQSAQDREDFLAVLQGKPVQSFV